MSTKKIQNSGCRTFKPLHDFSFYPDRIMNDLSGCHVEYRLKIDQVGAGDELIQARCDGSLNQSSSSEGSGKRTHPREILKVKLTGFAN